MRAFCDICFELFEDNNKLTATTCGHVFHENCIVHWMKQSQSCPICRCSINSDKITRLYFSLSQTTAESREHLENEVINLKAKMQEKDTELLRCKVEDKKLKYHLHAIKLEALRLKYEIKNSQLKFLQMIHDTKNWCVVLKDAIYHLRNLANFVKKSWMQTEIHQKAFKIEILKLQMELETCKSQLQEYESQSKVQADELNIASSEPLTKHRKLLPEHEKSSNKLKNLSEKFCSIIENFNCGENNQQNLRDSVQTEQSNDLEFYKNGHE